MKSIIDWTATPIGSAVLGYVLIGLCTFLFKAKTPEAYAATAARGKGPIGRFLWPRWAALWQFLGGLLLDPAKVAEALAKLITGHVKPLTVGTVAADPRKGDDESGPYRDGMLLVLVCALPFLGAAAVIAACSSTSSTQQTPAQTKAQRRVEAGGSYTVDLDRCGVSQLYPTFAESKACSANVREAWHRLPDGGADPAWFLADGGVR